MKQQKNRIEKFLKDYKNSIISLMYLSGINKRNKDKNY